MATGVFGVISNLGAMILGGAAMRSAYEKWTELDRQATVKEKIWIVFEGCLGALQLGSGATSLATQAYEYTYKQDQKFADGVLKEVTPYCPQMDRELDDLARTEKLPPFPKVLEDPRVLAIMAKYSTSEKIDRLADIGKNEFGNLETYRSLNGILTGLQAIQAAYACYQEAYKCNDGETLYLRVTEVALHSGGLAYLSYSRYYCNERMEITSKGPAVFSSLSLLLKIKEVINPRSKSNESINKMVEGRIFTPYKLPSSMDDSSLNYADFPSEYEEDEEFCESTCPISQTPILKALFIFHENNIPVIFEKKSLVHYFLHLKQRGQPLKHPAGHALCKESDIYQCAEWDYNRMERLAQRQREDLTRLMRKEVKHG